MAGDGVSLQTNISQLGNVARTQAKGQQAQQTLTPFAEQLDKKDELRIQRVRETEKAEKDQIDPEERDRRKERRRRRKRRREAEAEAERRAEAAEETGGERPDRARDDEACAPALGGLIDLRV
jgi:hypothetical protein